jgi:hypothetical protein
MPGKTSWGRQAFNSNKRRFRIDERVPGKPLGKTGLEVPGDPPWGAHYCLFFDVKKDLPNILVPYFTTGLANNEFRFWVLADLLVEDEARYALPQPIFSTFPVTFCNEYGSS